MTNSFTQEFGSFVLNCPSVFMLFYVVFEAVVQVHSLFGPIG